MAEMTARRGRLEDPLLLDWVTRIGGEVAKHSSRRHLRYRFHILNTNENNAYSLPGGHLAVTAGLLNHVASDEELAGVLGHEIAHADNRDFSRLLREQGLFWGLLGLIRGRVGEGVIVASQVAQLLQGFHSSRRHEGQADQAGARLCLQAAYDPQGILEFLETVGPAERGLGRLFATHPGGPQRRAAMDLAIRELEASRYDLLVALARSLQARGHLRRAAAVAGRAARSFPREAEPLLILAAVQQQRGEQQAAAQTREEARRRQGEPAPRGNADSGAPAAPPPSLLTLPEPLRRQVEDALAQLRTDQKVLHDRELLLRRRLTELAADREIAAALEAGQIVAPETNERAYLSTVARAYLVLARAREEALREGEVLARSVSVRSGWERVAADLRHDKVIAAGAEKLAAQELAAAARAFVAQARPGVQATTAEVTACAAACSQLRAAARLLALAYLALLASGDDQPLGHLNYTRFLLLQGDIAVAEARVRRAEHVGERGLGVVFEQHLRVMQVALTTLHAGADPPLRTLDLSLVAQRIAATPQELAQQAAGSSLGEAAGALLRPRVQATGLGALQVQDCLLRIAYLDLLAERTAAGAAGTPYAPAPAAPRQ